MSSKEIVLWLDQRWYDALSKQLKDETLEEHLESVLDQMCDQLPQREYERISQEIWRERQQAEQEREAARRFAVFRVTEEGDSVCFSVNEPLEMLQSAARLRGYLRRSEGDAPTRFVGMFSQRERISQERFDAYVTERLDNTGRVTGAFDIDLDKGEFSTLNIMDGWQSFAIKDVSTAVYFAMKNGGAALAQRWETFLDRLDGKLLTADTGYGFLRGERDLTGDDISFSGEVLQEDQFLEFYMDVNFDADAVFGTHVCTTENDDYLNVYAGYDLETGQVRDTLTVILIQNDNEMEYRYRLSDAERAAMLPKMDSCCQRQLGMTLEQCRERYLAEEEELQSSPELEM